jgi:hypothetical protein
MPPAADEFEKFVSHWLNLKRSDGFEARQRAYWIERIPRDDSTPRWVHLKKRVGRRRHSSLPPPTTMFRPTTRNNYRMAATPDRRVGSAFSTVETSSLRREAPRDPV